MHHHSDFDLDLTGLDEADPTPDGIMHCLRLLAEEAASLRLGRTLAALRAAIDVCSAESITGADALLH